MLAKDVKRGEMIRKVFDLGEVKDYSYKDESGETVRRQKFIITSNRRDRDRDIVDPAGAMVDDYANNPVMLWAHQYDQMPIAKSVEMTRFEKAVQTKDGSTEVRQQIAALVTYVPDKVYPKGWTGITGSMVADMYDLGFLNAVSIGFDPWDWEEIEDKDGRKESQFDDIFGTGTLFKSWDMLEFSAVPVPSNPEALVDRKMRKMFMKSLKSWANETIKQCDVCAAKGNHSHEFEKQEAEEFLKEDGEDMTETKGVIGYNQTPKSDSQSWDGPAQVAAADVDDLKIICTWFDSESPDIKTSYKLPHHLASGEHTLIKAGLIGCGNSVQGARSPLKIPAGDLPGVKSHLEKHYHEFDMKAPWEPDSDSSGGKAVEDFNKMMDISSKQGRVLSGKNEQDLRDAVDHHTAGVKLTNNVLGQVTNTPTQGSSAEPPTSWDYDAEANQGGASEAGSGADAANPGITKAHVNTGDCLGCPNFDDANVVCKKDLDPATCGLANLYNEGLKSMTEEKAPTAPNPGDCGNCTGDNFNGGKCDVGKSPDTCGMTKSMKQPTKPNPGDCGKCVGDHFGGGKCEVGKSPDNCGETGASKSMTPVDVIGAAIGKAVVDYLKTDKTAKTVTNAATDDELFEVDEDMLNDVLKKEFGLDGAESAE